MNRRTRLWLLMFVLAALLGVPLSPEPLVILYWIILLGLIVFLALGHYLIRLFYLLAFVVGILTFLKLKIWYPVFMISLSGAWGYLNSQRKRSLLILVLGAGSRAEVVYGLEAPLPKFSSSYKLEQITGCAQIERIPWKFSKDGKKARLLIKDELRWDRESTYSKWEFYQIIDKDGATSHVIRRVTANGRYDSLVLKELSYNRIVDTPKGRKILDVQRFGNVMGKSVFSFYSKNQSEISYSPGVTGSSTLTLFIKLPNKRVMDPILLPGAECERPEEGESAQDAVVSVKTNTENGTRKNLDDKAERPGAPTTPTPPAAPPSMPSLPFGGGM